MTLISYLSDILDRIKTAIQSIHIEMFDENYSGTTISFTSKVAGIPLDNFSIDVQGYQEGSGIPNPVNNIRPIINYDSVNVNQNGNVDTIQIGDTFYTGKLYPNLGLFVPTRGAYTIKDTDNFVISNQNYIKSDACDCYLLIPSEKICPSVPPNGQPNGLISSHFAFARTSIWSSDGYPNTFTINSNQIHFNIANDLIGITDYTQETIASARTKITNWLHTNPVTITFATSRIINLTPTQIKTIIGNNSFSANRLNMNLKIAKPKLKSHI